MQIDVFSRYFGLQNKPSSGLKKKSEYKHKMTVTYMSFEIQHSKK